MRSRHISVVIERDPAEVYAFAAEPDNLPRWAAGLAQSEVRREWSSLIAQSPMGEVAFTFTPPNALGVLDHDVRLPSGKVITNPLRVIAHPQGSELIFTLRQIGLTDAQFDEDAAMVERDLAQLKALLEQAS